MKREFYNAEVGEMESFEKNLNIWCQHHPLNCSKCNTISQCKKTPICPVLTLNYSENTYRQLEVQLDYLVSKKSISRYISGWDNQIKVIKKTKRVIKLFNYLNEFSAFPYKNDVELSGYLKRLNDLYNEFKLGPGLKLVKEVVKRYPFQEDVIRSWALFHNRRMDWTTVREILGIKINLTINNNVKTECYLGIFESHLNEFTKKRHEQGAFNKLDYAKTNFLDKIPDKECVGHYYYFLARYYEEEWWISSEKTKKATNTLKLAIDSINESISLYKEKLSGYGANNNNPWWLFCHKAILFKLWRHEMYDEVLNQFYNMIEIELKNNPKKKSAQIYMVTYYLLLDNEKKLVNFLADLKNTMIENLPNNSSEDKLSDIDNFTYHHLELLFYQKEDKFKYERYYEIINDWFKSTTK